MSRRPTAPKSLPHARRKLTIGQAAEYLGVAPHTLREWTRLGIVGASRTAGGHRRYDPADLERLLTTAGGGQRLEEAHLGVRELAALAATGKLFQSVDPDEVVRDVCVLLIDAMDCWSATVSRYDRQGDAVVTLADYNRDGTETPPEDPYPLNEYPTTAQVIHEQGPMLTNVSDPDADPAERQFLERFGNKSLLVLPLVLGDETIGIVELVDKSRERDYTPAEMSLARALCAQVAAAMNNATNFHQLQRRLAEFEIMDATTEALTRRLDPRELLQDLAEHLSKGLDVCRCYIHDFDPESERLTIVARACIRGAIDEMAPVGSLRALEPGRASTIAVEGRRVAYARLDDPAVAEVDRRDLEARGERSSMNVPVVYEDAVIGLLEIAAVHGYRHFSAEDERLASNIANKAAVAINNARIVERLRGQNAEQQLLLSTGSAIASSVDLDETLGTITRLLTETLGAAWCDIYNYDREANTATVIAFYQIKGVAAADGWMGTVYHIDKFPEWQRCVDAQAAVVITEDDPGQSEEYRADSIAWEERVALTVPLLYQNELIGLLDVAESRCVRHFTDEEIALTMAIANQAAVAIHNASLFDEAKRRNDELATVLAVAQALTATTDLDKTLGTLARLMREAVPVECVEIYAYDAEHREIRLLAAELAADTGGYEPPPSYPVDASPDVSEAIDERRPVEAHTDDPALDDSVRREMEAVGERSSLCVPMVYADELVGVVYFSSHVAPHRFADDQVRLAIGLAQQGAVALVNARAFRSLEEERSGLARLNRRLGDLVEVSGRMRGLMDESEVFGLLGEVMSKTLDFNEWVIYLNEPDRGVFTVTAVHSDDAEIVAAYRDREIPAAVFEEIVAAAVPISQSHFVDSLRWEWSDEASRHFVSKDLGRRTPDQWQADDSLFVPMIGGDGTLIGYLEPYDPADRRRPTEQLVRLLEVFASKAAANLELQRLHRRLEEQATTDGLTGLANHRYLDERLEEEVAKAERYGHPLSVLMIDIDDFKVFNDTFGHPVGDRLLVKIAEILRECVRQKIDLAARYGGEEFVVMLPNTPCGGASVAAERVRSAIEGGTGEDRDAGSASGEPRDAGSVAEAIRGATESATFEGLPRRGDTRITVSVGVATLPEHGRTPMELLARSDKALYVSKRLGKNRVSVYRG